MRDQNKKEIDLVIVKDNILYPIEIKKSSNPSKSALKNFNMLDKLNTNIGHGAIICLSDTDKPISENINIIPVSYL